jgi:signal transduction histidine kinase
MAHNVAMHEQRSGKSSTQRGHTDESLRDERSKVDANAELKRDAMEERADAVMQVAREKADAVVEVARDKADEEGTSESLQRKRAQADSSLAAERAQADAKMQRERDARKSYLAAFLMVEREATDKDLTEEREHADAVIAAQDEFLATVSHDLRSLLSGLAINTHLLESESPKGAAGEGVRKRTQSSARLLARMNRLVNDLLDVTAIEAGKLAVAREHTQVDTVLSDTLIAFEAIAQLNKITLTADASSASQEVTVDGGRIMQVLANLVSNAIKFTKAGGRVSIHARQDANGIEFTVSDTGIGIAKDALPGIFDRFSQVRFDRRGLGLGLHISRAIVEAHGGKIWAESEVGKGSTFHFTVPAS